MHKLDNLIAFSALAGLSLQQSAGSGSAGQTCPYLGPDFPPPSDLASSSVLEEAKKAFEKELSNAPFAGSNTTSYSIALFSAKTNETLYETHYTAQNVRDSPMGVDEIDGDSVYRIASISKVFAVWNFLINAGDVYFNRPITEFVPELRSINNASDEIVYDDVANYRWEDVTIGNLAGQMSGMLRDVAQGEVAESLPLPPAEIGLPELQPGEAPVCGTIITPSCDRQQFFELLSKASPVFATTQSPVYSNIAYELLSYALETISNKPYNTSLVESIFEPLGMSRSSYPNPAQNDIGVIPGPNTTLTGWGFDIGIDNAGGAVYASTNDLVAAGRSILTSSLLPKAETRRWLKPVSNTPSTTAYVGAPWEIYRLESPNGRATDLYTKSGGLGSYMTFLILDPDHEVGMTIMTAVEPSLGPSGSVPPVEIIRDAMVNTFIPAIEEAARQEAKENLAGTYTDAETNSTVTLSVDEGMGLIISDFLSRGKPTLDFVSSQLGSNSTLPRLYPSLLNTVKKTASGDGTYVSRMGFRASFTPEPTEEGFAKTCINWFLVSSPLYGGRAVDDFVFEMGEDGVATGLNVRGLRLNLSRQS